MKEYLLTTDEFNKPKTVEGKDAIFLQIVRLFLLEKNTYQSNPDMGLGLVSRFRYGYDDDLTKLQLEAESQISTYLPELTGTSVEISKDTANAQVLLIKVSVDNTMYQFTFNTTTLELSSL